MRPDGSRFSMARGRLYFIAVWFVYSGAAFLLYRQNAVGHGAGDGWLFLALPLLAWTGYWFALGASPYLRPRSWFRQCGIAVLSFAGLFFSTWFWLLVAVNTYGE